VKIAAVQTLISNYDSLNMVILLLLVLSHAM
jgi:hypothetical protein